VAGRQQAPELRLEPGQQAGHPGQAPDQQHIPEQLTAKIDSHRKNFLGFIFYFRSNFQLFKVLNFRHFSYRFDLL
jgi:hypothetical protein